MAIFRNFGTEALKQSDPMRIQEDEIKTTGEERREEDRKSEGTGRKERKKSL